MTQTTDHLARPGPFYWDWRCLTCDQPCADHLGIIAYLWKKWTR